MVATEESAGVHQRSTNKVMAELLTKDMLFTVKSVT